MGGIRLASASKRRKRLLLRLVQGFRVAPVHISERLKRGESFPAACKRLAREKAGAAASRRPGALVIGADTIAYLGKKNFRKTDDAGDARAALRALSGKVHTVATGVCVAFPDGREVSYVEMARVKMKEITPQLLEWYVKSGEWKGRAGSYDVSGKGARLVASVKGEKETVVGLPLRRLRLILEKEKKKWRAQRALAGAAASA
jgi:septum formation protein